MQLSASMVSRVHPESPKGRKEQQPFSEKDSPMAKVYINSIMTYLFLIKMQTEHGNKINVNSCICCLGKFTKHLNLLV